MKTRWIALLLVCVLQAAVANSMFDMPVGAWSHHDDPHHTFTVEFGPHHDMSMSYAEQGLDGNGRLARGDYRVLATKNGDWHATFKVKSLSWIGYTPPGQSRCPREVSILGLTLHVGDEVNFFFTHEDDRPPTFQMTTFDTQQQPVFSRVVMADDQ